MRDKSVHSLNSKNQEKAKYVYAHWAQKAFILDYD